MCSNGHQSHIVRFASPLCTVVDISNPSSSELSIGTGLLLKINGPSSFEPLVFDLGSRTFNQESSRIVSDVDGSELTIKWTGELSLICIDANSGSIRLYDISNMKRHGGDLNIIEACSRQNVSRRFGRTRTLELPGALTSAVRPRSARVWWTLVNYKSTATSDEAQQQQHSAVCCFPWHNHNMIQE
ncbi:hypothetical protein BDR06DRAFT_978095, partial [Suillus hirtellus]